MILKFKPLLKRLLWGTESWEISAVKDNETVVAEGDHAGKALSTLVKEMGATLVGEENMSRFGTEFPLLIKFIDAKMDLSIQVHPTDEIARRQGRERGKTEMWYLLDCQPGAKLYSGLRKAITPEEYAAVVANDTICDALAQYEVQADDVFFLPAGRIHAIGAGCRLAEIQQTSDVTWRIYDFKRRDKEGNLRELHTQQAAEAIDYHVESDYRTPYRRRKNEGVNLVSCEYFNTAVYDLTEPMVLDYSELDTFVVLIALEGSGTLCEATGACGEEERTAFVAGETVLLPATTREIRVEGNVKFLETYV